MRVLIVEDDAIVAMHLAMLLTELGHETCGTAASAATAIAQAAKYEPDIVLMDIRLAQGSSGIEAARERPPILAMHFSQCEFVRAGKNGVRSRSHNPLGRSESIEPATANGFVRSIVLPLRTSESVHRGRTAVRSL